MTQAQPTEPLVYACHACHIYWYVSIYFMISLSLWFPRDFQMCTHPTIVWFRAVGTKVWFKGVGTHFLFLYFSKCINFNIFYVVVKQVKYIFQWRSHLQYTLSCVNLNLYLQTHPIDNRLIGSGPSRPYHTIQYFSKYNKVKGTFFFIKDYQILMF